MENNLLSAIKKKNLETKRFKIRNGNLLNYQVFDAKTGRGASVVEHLDGELNVVNRDYQEEYNGYDPVEALKAITRILGR